MSRAISKFINQVVTGDCLEVMADMPDNCVDMCFADPPFNLKKKYSSYDDSSARDSYLSWSRQWLSEMVRIVKPSGSIFVHNIPKWLACYGALLNESAIFRHWIAWNATGPLGKTLLPAHYGILFYVKNEKRFKFYDLRAPHVSCRVCGNYLKDYGGKEALRHPFGALVSDVWTDIHRIRHNQRRDPHPCQLPVHLLERLILMSTDAGDVVLDPFLGTGTTAIAAKVLGRRYVGIEMDAEYGEIARSKIAAVKETTYRGAYISRFLGNIITIRDADSAKIIGTQTAATKKAARARQTSSDKKTRYNGGTADEPLTLPSASI